MGLMPRRSGFHPPNIRRVVVVIPSAFTLGNLFFGIWAIVSAYNRNFLWAGWFVVFAGVLDMLDGRVARLSNTGSRFGAELDSLVDVISFGVAPALILYFLEFAWAGKFAWLLCYFYVVAVAVRLARYNVQHDERPTPGWFTGMPSPSAGMTLAVYYPFSQTNWYQASLAYLNLQKEGLAVLMVVLSLLIVSTVKYPRFPPIGFRSVKGIFGLTIHLAILLGGLLAPRQFLFPLGLAYMGFGVARTTILGLLERTEGPVAAAERLGARDRRTLPRIGAMARPEDESRRTEVGE
ncbi:MAG: CDP-diacylglycerol--serine O-phosphatidyltransferase [Gemmatimonadales bacterium]